MSESRTLRKLLERPGLVRSLGAHDVFSARIMEAAGVELLFLGGFGASASSLGLPDVGLTTLSEMAEAVRRMTARLNVPLIADGDTGYGDVHNVSRTVREFEQAGAAGLILEDQLAPKRCGHFDGKQIVSPGEMRAKLRAALDARRDADFVVVARTDAIAVEGIDAAIERANLYGEAGADVCFVEAPQSRGDLERVAGEVRFPLLVNMLTGGNTPILSADELEQLGYKIMVCPVASLLLTGFAVQSLADALMAEGRVDQLSDFMQSLDDVKRVLGFDAFVKTGTKK